MRSRRKWDWQVNLNIGFYQVLLFFILLLLRVTDAINISWIWVFAPIWIPFSILGLICGFALIITAIVWIVETIKDLIK